ncbi:hypothetical protein [Thiopseudomonas denitrificans]|uniref:Uncharacterized protein n=1 Tax=Thiopseudomonas denitrificans TaxID=1501432 RepID=A0A4R6TZC9_9GAMM|nr:hypothetical protein [Thiopseudomonas denitrificans]TDQ39330.1 hypothetical protein DFQ45_10218 [Thiopseudomonas denitrificans]
MTALLILGGALLAVLGWLWLWLRSARIHWFWALTGVLPPLALLSGLLNLRHALLPLLVQLAGLGLLGSGLWQLWQADPQQLERLLHGQWSEQQILAVDAGQLQGQLQGQSFLPGQVLLERGVLTLRQGQDFIASKELRIDLRAHGAALLDEEFRLDILPTDSGLLPMVEVLWQDGQTAQPQARRIQRGYTLRLDLKRQPAGVDGQLYLSLPSRLATVVSGNFHVSAADEQTDPDWYRAQPQETGATDATELPATSAGSAQPLALEQLLTRPDNYLRHTMSLETVAGRQLDGEFQGINEEGELLIRQRVGKSGFAVFHVMPDEVSQILLLNP